MVAPLEVLQTNAFTKCFPALKPMMTSLRSLAFMKPSGMRSTQSESSHPRVLRSFRMNES